MSMVVFNPIPAHGPAFPAPSPMLAAMFRPLALATLVMLAACTGSSTTTTQPAVTTSTSVAPSSSAVTTTTTLGPLDVTVPDISGYRYELTASTGFDVDEGTADVTVAVAGDYMAPDSHRFLRSVGFAGLETEVGEAVVIGDQAWIRSGEDWTETISEAPSIGELAGPISSLAGNVLPAPDLLEQLYRSPGQRQEVDGIAARRYDLDAAAVGALAEVAGEEFFSTELADLADFSMTVWVAEIDGTPLRWRIEMSGPVELLSPEITLDLPPDAAVQVEITVDFLDVGGQGPVIEPPV